MLSADSPWLISSLHLEHDRSTPEQSRNTSYRHAYLHFILALHTRSIARHSMPAAQTADERREWRRKLLSTRKLTGLPSSGMKRNLFQRYRNGASWFSIRICCGFQSLFGHGISFLLYLFDQSHEKCYLKSFSGYSALGGFWGFQLILWL